MSLVSVGCVGRRGKKKNQESLPLNVGTVKESKHSQGTGKEVFTS